MASTWATTTTTTTITITITTTTMEAPNSKRRTKRRIDEESFLTFPIEGMK